MPQDTRATERHTAALRPVCRSIPAARFRHSAELNGATRAALNSPPNALRTQRRSRRKWAGAHSMSPAVISGRAGFPVADNGCRPAPPPFHRPPHPFARPAAIDTTRTPDISRRTCETDSPTAFWAADNLPGVETIVRHSCPQFTPCLGHWLSKAVRSKTFQPACKRPILMIWARNANRHRRGEAWIWQQTAMIGMSFALFALSDKSVPMIAEAF